MGKIRVDSFADMKKAANNLIELSGTYAEISKSLLQVASTMGAAWDGADNQAYVQQINGLSDDLQKMSDKLNLGGETLKQITTNYEERQSDNIAQVQKLAN